jgi:hypothetical protein
VRHLLRAGILAFIPMGFAVQLAGQQPPDSLVQLVRRAEDALRRLQAQLAEQSPTTVRSHPRPRVDLSGLILANGFYNSGKTDHSDIPLFADTLVPADTLGLPNANAGGTVRQTRVELTVSAVHALGAIVTGRLQLDFLGGQQVSPTDRAFLLARARAASLRLDWAHAGLLVGQDEILIAPQDPVSFASFAGNLFGYSGNLWYRAPQVRITAETSWSAHLGIQAAALAPMQPLAQGLVQTQPDSAERSGRPSLEGRLYLAWGSGEVSSEIGVGGHIGWLATTGDSTLQSRLLAADARIAFGPHLGIAGEAFTGQALGSLGGAIGQNLGHGHVPVRSRGAWIQVDIHPGAGWQLGGGYGVDDPNDADLPNTGRGRNVTYAGHLIWQPGGGLLFGTEWRRIATTYAGGTLAVHHVNWYTGLAF